MFRLVIFVLGISLSSLALSARLVNPVPRNTIWTYASLLDTGSEVLDCGGLDVSFKRKV